MHKVKVTVKNKEGLTARHAAILVRLASKFKSDFYIHAYGYKVNGKSILGVMTLAVQHGTNLEIELSGEDEDKAKEAIEKIFENGFKISDEK